jgi:cysteine desulfuration protein SufE
MSKTIHEIESEIIEEFELFDDWMDKYKYIIEMGQDLKSISDEHKIDENIVRGCQSQVWLLPSQEGDKIHFEADSDAIITKGLVGLLTRVLSDQKPDDILNAELGFIDAIGLRDHLSPTRSNGLNAMIKKMRMYAFAYGRREAGGEARSEKREARQENSD